MYTFADFFCWIWWFHIALERLWLECALACDIDKHARETYYYNFSGNTDIFEKGLFYEDITKIDEKSLPDFDIFCWWFPCQPFSQAWHKLWFGDTRWTLFFDIVRIIKEKKPKVFFLENVRHLVKHDNWNTFNVIQEILTKELDYTFNYQIIKASDYWLPQFRPRVYMVWFRKEDLIADYPEFIFPKKQKLKLTMSDIFWWECDRKIWFTLRVWGRGSPINDRRNWDWYVVDGKERRLWIEEGKMMMWFPKDYHFPVSKVQAIKQLWNGIAVNPVYETGKKILEYLKNYTK